MIESADFYLPAKKKQIRWGVLMPAAVAFTREKIAAASRILTLLYDNGNNRTSDLPLARKPLFFVGKI